MRYVVAVHQRRDDLDLLMRTDRPVEVVLLKGVQQAGDVVLVVTHHALVFDRNTNGVGHVLDLVGLRLATEHLVERHLACDGRGCFRL